MTCGGRGQLDALVRRLLGMADNPALPVFWIWVGLTGLAVGVAALAPRLLEWAWYGGRFASYRVRVSRSASNPANFAGSSNAPPSARRAVP